MKLLFLLSLLLAGESSVAQSTCDTVECGFGTRCVDDVVDGPRCVVKCENHECRGLEKPVCVDTDFGAECQALPSTCASTTCINTQICVENLSGTGQAGCIDDPCNDLDCLDSQECKLQEPSPCLSALPCSPVPVCVEVGSLCTPSTCPTLDKPVCVDTEEGAVCEAPKSTCASTTCINTQICVENLSGTGQAGCIDNPCNELDCLDSQECRLQDSFCLSAPCPGVPVCVQVDSLCSPTSCPTLDKPICVDTEDGAVCEAPKSTCASVTCINTQICVENLSGTGQAGCADNPCDNFECEAPELCILRETACISTPCFPLPACVVPTMLGCTDDLCNEPGTRCVDDRVTGARCVKTCEAAMCSTIDKPICVETDQGAECVAPMSTCATTTCINTQICVENYNGDGQTACIDNPCDGFVCDASQRCVLQEVDCVTSPCPPVAVCEELEPELTCVNVDCAPGNVCVENAEEGPTCIGTCRVSFCPPDKPICTDTEEGPVCEADETLPTFTCANILCEVGFVCLEDSDGQGTAGCLPNPCNDVNCFPETCFLEFDVVCIQAPCFPIPQCGDPVITGPTCATVRCEPSFVCMESPTGAFCEPEQQPNPCTDFECPPPQVCIPQVVECVVAPCLALPLCVPPLQLGCVNTECEPGTRCVDDPITDARCVEKCTPTSCTSLEAQVCNDTDQGPVCLAPRSTCASTTCINTQICVENYNGDGQAACIDDPCEGFVCDTSQRCILQEVDCVTIPCPPTAVCEDLEPELTCDNVDCAVGNVCVENSEEGPTCIATCVLALCPLDKPICTDTDQGPICEVDESLPSITCANILCEVGNICVGDFDGQGTAGCVPTPCSEIDCNFPETCVLDFEVSCIWQPCLPIATCQEEPVPTCATVDCVPGFACSETSDGPVCEPVPTLTCANVLCSDVGQICLEDAGDGGPGCVAKSGCFTGPVLYDALTNRPSSAGGSLVDGIIPPDGIISADRPCDVNIQVLSACPSSVISNTWLVLKAKTGSGYKRVRRGRKEKKPPYMLFGDNNRGRIFKGSLYAGEYMLISRAAFEGFEGQPRTINKFFFTVEGSCTPN